MKNLLRDLVWKKLFKNALLTFKGDTDFYEMMILLQKITSFKGIGLSYRTFLRK